MAKSAARGLNRLKNLRRAPEKLLLLINEISDFQIVLAMFQDTSQQLEEQRRDLAHDQYFQELIERAQTTLMAINELLALIIGPDPTQLSLSTNRNFSWKAWLKTQGQIDRLFITLRDLRRDIASASTLLAASEVPRLRNELHRISLDTQQLSSRLQSVVAETGTTELDTDPSAELAQRMPSLMSILTQTPGAQTTVVHAQTSLQLACNPLCMCRCHHSIKIRTPAWLRSFLGFLFIGYSGTPLLPRGACSEKSCQRRNSSVLKLNYYFPSWLIHRMIVFRNKSTPSDGRVFTVRTPRVVSSAGEIFTACRLGNMDHIHRLFAGGLASPFDVDEHGNTPLFMALTSKDATVCKLLLDEYADPEQEDNSLRTPIDAVWTELFINPLEEQTQQLRAVFSPYLDPSDLQRREFTIIHRIVLGLTPISLTDQLRLSTADIDSRCSLGRTPLTWAVLRSDPTSVKVLIDFGADMDIVDGAGGTCVHWACESRVTKDGLSSLRIILQERDDPEDMVKRYNLVNRRVQGINALTIAALNNNVECVRLLLDRGAKSDIENQDAISFAVRDNSHEVVEFLLSRGLRQLNCTEPDGKGILHMVAILADYKMIQILTETRLYGIPTDLKDMYGNTPLQSFLDVRPNYRSESDAERRACLAAFTQLLKSVVPDLDEEPSPINPGLSNDLDMEVLSSLSDSDEEEFFEPRSEGGSAEPD